MKKKRTYKILVRSHQNDICNFSPALIQLHVERKPLTGLQFDVRQNIKLILGKHHFRASDSSVVTFTPRNYASKSNFRKRCCLCYDNEIGTGQKMQKQNINKSRNLCKTYLLKTYIKNVFAALLTNFCFIL